MQRFESLFRAVREEAGKVTFSVEFICVKFDLVRVPVLAGSGKFSVLLDRRIISSEIR